MGAAQRRELHAYARSYVTKYTSQAWAHSFVAELQRHDGAVAAPSHAPPLRLANVARAYLNSSRRLLVIGVGGGAYSPAAAAPTLASSGDAPPDVVGTEVSDLLRQLLRDPANVVLVTSSRSRARMGELLDSLGGAGDDGAPAGELWALAENGVFARRGDGGWEATVQAAQESSWMEMAHEVCSYYAERTPESVLEVRERTIRWGYAAAAADLAAARRRASSNI